MISFEFKFLSDSDDLTHLHQVKEIRGQLVINNNYFSDLNFFPNLETVDAMDAVDGELIALKMEKRNIF